MSHPSMQFFNYDHLPENLQYVSEKFHKLAVMMDAELPDNPEKSAMMRKLMEAKDCAVRANIFKPGDDT